MDRNPKVNWSGLLNLGIIYIVWGSTYLAIRVMVRDGSGFSPFWASALRVSTAGFALLLWSKFKNRRIKLQTHELKILILCGILLWVGGNGLVSWSEKQTSSGLAALMIAAMPVWSALVIAVMDKELPKPKMVAALVIGFGGMMVLSYPVLKIGIKADLWSIIGLLFAGLSWGTGSVIQTRKPVSLDPIVSAGYQQLFGGLGLLIIAVVVREPLPRPIPEAWYAWGYLWVFGSIIAFTSFVRALQLLPTKVVMTYPYINPVIAIFLGWLILDESFTLWSLIGGFLILLGVVGIFRERYREQ